MNWKRKWIVGLMAVVMVLSLLLNVVLYGRARQFYQWFNMTRLNPLGLNEFTSQDWSVADLQRPIVVLYGDSRAAAWPAPEGTKFHFVNRGINGQSTAQIRQRFADHVAPLEPDVVVIQAGVNDLVSLAVLRDQQAAIVAATLENLQAVIDASVALDATVIVSTIFPTGPVSSLERLFWSSGVNEAIAEVNQALRSIDHPKVIVLDAYALLGDIQGQVQPAFRIDALHINAAGYETLNHALKRVLAEISPQ